MKSLFKNLTTKVFIITSCVLLVNVYYQYSTGFGNWTIEYAGAQLKNYADPSGAYIESGVHLFKEKSGTFPGHPGMLNKLIVRVVATIVYWFSSQEYYESAVRNYYWIAVFTKIIQSTLFIIVLSFLVRQLSLNWGNKINRMIFIIILLLQPYFWIYFDAIAPESFVYLASCLLAYGLVKEKEHFVIIGFVIIGISKFMLIPLFVPLLLLSGKRILLISTISIIGIYLLYFTHVSLIEFKNFWFLFSPAGISGGENELTHNIAIDTITAIRKLILFSFERIKYLVIEPQHFGNIYQINIPMLLLISTIILLLLNKSITKRAKAVFLTSVFFTIALYLFRLESHYLVPSILVISYYYLSLIPIDISQKKWQYLTLVCTAMLIFQFYNVFNFYRNNVKQSKEFVYFYHINKIDDSIIQKVKQKGINYYYPYQIGYTTNNKEMPMYITVKQYFNLKE